MTDASDLSQLLGRLQAKDRAALNRLVSLASRGEVLDAIDSSLEDDSRRTPVIAITGNSGVGKSSLVARLIELVRSRGETVAVMACDPESALTGGALLGDRVRMSAHSGDEGVWIRSFASASGRQAVAGHLDVVAKLLSRFGFDHIFLETVGAGQGDIAVDTLADVVVLLIQPEIGDELQWEKAGVLEVADIVVVHKGDLPGADRTETQARELLNLPGARETPVLRVSSKSNEGIDNLWTAIAAAAGDHRHDNRNARALLRLVQETVADRFSANATDVRQIADAWNSGRLSGAEAIAQVLTVIGKSGADR